MSRTFLHKRSVTVFTTITLLLSVRACEAIELPQVVVNTLETYFEKPDADQMLGETLKEHTRDPRFQKRLGVFVTLSRNGKSRACWGSIYPSAADLVQSTVLATLQALTNEYRYKPITPGEWKLLKPQVTIINEVQPISSLQSVNPLRDGLMVRAGGKSGVLLPRETTDAYYQLVQCKLKAGIKPGESYQLYKLKAQIYE